MSHTIHCTKKLLDRVKPSTNAVPVATTTFLGNWYATALFWKPQAALLISEKTLLPVFMPLAPASDIGRRFPNHLASVLRAHGAPHALVEHEMSATLDFQYSKTANRSLVGMLNQFTYLAEGYRDHPQYTDLLWLSMRLSETPCSPLYKTAISPDRELHRLVKAEWGVANKNDKR